MAKQASQSEAKPLLSKDTYTQAYRLMCTARAMSDIYEENAKLTSKYVHATSRGHEAIQLALGMQLKPQDFVSPYYRDDSILLGIGMEPKEIMLQLFAKKDDPFSGGRTYYCHPSLRDENKPKIPHQSSATGMQAIPSAGLAMGIQYLEQQGLLDKSLQSVAVCSIGDAATTEGEISEALHMASLKKLPFLFFVQDNEWDISAHAKEIRSNDAAFYAKGFKNIEVIQVDGSDFEASYLAVGKSLKIIREERRPVMLHATVPLLGHHTSGVRREWYRDDLEEHKQRDPLPRLREWMLQNKQNEASLQAIEKETLEEVEHAFHWAQAMPDPEVDDVFTHDFAPTPITEETGSRAGVGKEKTLMVDCALFAVQEILAEHPEALLYGQDVGGRLGGVFREAATLAQKFGDDRVFNTPIQEAFIIGSTVGMSIAGAKPIVEVQFADYIWPGLNQLFTELSRSYYLSNGKWNVQSLIRVPIGAYGSGGPYHSGSVESILTSIKGIKVVYPSNGADLKGLMKAAFYDPNPVIMLEHKGLYWSKLPGTEDAACVEPDEEYKVPLGSARIAQEASQTAIEGGKSIGIITYGMGVYWSKTASKAFPDQVEILDLRTLSPMDEEAMDTLVRKHGKVLIVTEEPKSASFAQSLAGKLQERMFSFLDAPIYVLGAKDLPAIPLNSTLEAAMIPNADKVAVEIRRLLEY